MACSQLLVTDADFRNDEFRDRLKETVTSLVSNKIVPIFNENDAISTRKAPYNDESGIFWDNDSLAALLARELGADLLLLLSDVSDRTLFNTIKYTLSDFKTRLGWKQCRLFLE